MDKTAMLTLLPKFRHNKKMMPLTRALIETATEQGASLREFQDAAELAVEILRDAQDQSKAVLEVFQGQVQTTFDGIEELLGANLL